MLPRMPWYSTANCCRTNFINFPAKRRRKTSMKPKSNRLNRNAAVSLAYLFFFLPATATSLTWTSQAIERSWTADWVFGSPGLHVCRDTTWLKRWWLCRIVYASDKQVTSPSAFGSRPPAAALIYCAGIKVVKRLCPGAWHALIEDPSLAGSVSLSFPLALSGWNLFICSDFEKKLRPLPGGRNFRPASASIIKLLVLSRLQLPSLELAKLLNNCDERLLACWPWPCRWFWFWFLPPLGPRCVCVICSMHGSGNLNQWD